MSDLPIGWPNDKSNWTQIPDSVFTSSNKLTISTSTKFVITDTGMVETGSKGMVNNSGLGVLFPNQIDDFYIGQISLVSEVPAGINHCMILEIKSDNVTVFKDLKPYLMPPTAEQPMVYTFFIPATQGLIDDGIEIFFEPDVEVDLWDVVFTANKTFNVGLA